MGKDPIMKAMSRSDPQVNARPFIAESPWLAGAMRVLRNLREPSPACAIVVVAIVEALGAREGRVLRADPQSGALYAIDESGAETPYLPEPGGPIAWVIDHETARFELRVQAPFDDGLWAEPAAAMAVLPLKSGGALQGILALALGEGQLDQLDRKPLTVAADGLAFALERASLVRALEHERARNTRLERTRSANEEKTSHLLHVIAQEIRTPLTAIKAYAEVMLERLGDHSLPRARFLGVINQECDRLGSLVSDLLEFVRLESKPRPLRLSRFALGPLIEDAIRLVEPVACARQVGFEVDVDAGLVVEGDSDSLRTALVHLAWNAAAFAPLSGRVRFEARARGENCLCTVEHAGESISGEEVKHVFDRFYSSRDSESLPGEAHALGLAITRHIVAAHGGQVWAEQVQPRGVRLCARLPRLQLASTRARRIAARIARSNDLGILFERTVEEAAALTQAGNVSLMWVDEEQGDLVIVAARGQDAAQLIGRHAPVRAGIAGSVAARGEPVLVGNIDSDDRFARLNHPQYPSKSLMSLPVRVVGETLGVLNVTNRQNGAAFDARDLAVVESLLARVGRTLDHAFTHGPDDRVLEAERAAGLFADVRVHPAASGERDRVALSRAVAREVGLLEHDAERIAQAASLLHAANAESAVPSGAETSGETQVDRHGPEVQRDVLRSSAYLARLREVIAGLDECWDGSGAPGGLAGQDIPLGSRILSVVHAYARMREGTPFMPRRGRQETLDALRDWSGRCFDPAVVEAFERALPWVEGEA